MDWTELYPESFSERMDRLQDRAAYERFKGREPTGAKVTWRMPAATRKGTVDDLAYALSVSVRMARKILLQGRVTGACRARKGRNHPWIVPLYFHEGRYIPKVVVGARGPALKAAAKRVRVPDEPPPF